MDRELYLALDKKISALLGKSTDILSDKEAREVQEYLDADEYGLALDSYVFFVDKNNAISDGLFHEIKLLANTMKIGATDTELNSLQKILGTEPNSP